MQGKYGPNLKKVNMAPTSTQEKGLEKSKYRLTGLIQPEEERR